MSIPDNIFERLVNEYKPKVVDGELEWELEPIDDGEPLIASTMPDKLLDIPDPGNQMAGNAAQLPSAKVSRQYSNTVRSFYDY